MELLPDRRFVAVALIVDINESAKVVRRGAGAQYTRDVLSGGIQAIENAGGEVVAFMGDAFLAVLPNVASTFGACVTLAKDLDRQCEYISDLQRNDPDNWSFAPGGPSLKVAFEWGAINSAEIASRQLGAQVLLVGDCINYAHRISGAGDGNRCVCGPAAARLLQEIGYVLEGPTAYESSKSDGRYEYFQLDLGDIWVSGCRADGEDSYWG